MKTNIYVLIDPRNNSIKYLGKTIKSLNKRLSSHMIDNSKSKKSSWIKSLKSQNLKPIIQLVDVVENDWEFWEEYWITNIKMLGIDLLNHTNGGEGMYGYIPTQETREKWSKAFKGRKKSKEWLAKIGLSNSKSIDVYSPTGELKHSFKSIKKASETLNIRSSHISTCCKGKLKSMNNLIFRYSNDPFNKYNTKWDSRTEILQIDKNGIIIKEWPSIIDAAKSFNIKAPNISRCLTGLRKTCKGFQWQYKIKI
jgi:hypothetical protein